MKKKYNDLFYQLDEVVRLFLEEVHKKNLSDMATEEWSVKDVLCHIVFWHTYYAQQYAALASGDKPMVFKGSATRNKDGVKSLRYKSRKTLEVDLNNAQRSLYKSIVKKEVPKMTYTIGREYTTKEFLELVVGHIQRHTVQVRRSKEN
jgi:hypothetical protein